MTNAITTGQRRDALGSPFATADVCGLAGLTVPDGTERPAFDDDSWNFTHVVGLPVQMPLSNRRFEFAASPRAAGVRSPKS
ncbi:MAG: hypothetical protein QOF66_642 [Mycobacterium sp.]|jgi:hypothetical protein|uniref:hypothetical protein n=1 Tax=Mycobacterium sp. TaxID=1785 RepID=UPI0028B89661|nr:hypothetical protein [Mycobacterium sp.]